MEFTLSRNNLLRALQHVRCAITKQQAQVFNCFVFSFPPATDGSPVFSVTIHASNGSVWIKETIPIEAPVPDASASGIPSEAAVPGASASGIPPFAIYYSDLLRPIKALDEQPLRFEVLEYQVIVHHSIGSFRLPLAQSASEFFCYKAPDPDATADDGYLLEYEAPCLKSILARCAFAMGQDNFRPFMNGVYVNLTDQFSDYVSSNGYILVRVRKNPVNYSPLFVGISFIIPYNVVKTLVKVLPSTGDLTVGYQKELIKKEPFVDSHGNEHFTTKRKPQCRITIDGNLTVSFNTVEGTYPKYWSVIPEHHDFSMTIDRRALVKSVDRLSLFAGEKNLLRMRISKDNLYLQTKDKDSDVEGSETLPCECRVVSGSPADIILYTGFNTSFLSQILKAISTEKVSLLFQDDQSRPVIIHHQPQPDNEEITMLLTPLFH